ncbi:MAG: dihydroorotate dehydrogenase-like protein [Acidobacteriota bacterium]
MPDLSTSYMNLTLKNPIIVASSDLVAKLDNVIRCQDEGAGAVVLKSIFEEQFLLEKDISEDAPGIYPEALDYLRSGALLDYAPQEVVRLISEAKKKISIPVIASINCRTPHLWPRFAKQLQDAGADGLELNIYTLPLRLDQNGDQIEKEYLRIVRRVKEVTGLPLAVKISNQFTSLPHFCRGLVEAGCDSLVLFNWFLEPDVDLDNLKIKNQKGAGNFHHVLRWIALLAGRVDGTLSASGGVKNGRDCLKLLLTGASAVQVCSLFYEKGLEEIKTMLKEIEDWMEEKNFSSIQDFKGELSFKTRELIYRELGEAEMLLRAQYVKTYSQ